MDINERCIKGIIRIIMAIFVACGLSCVAVTNTETPSYDYDGLRRIKERTYNKGYISVEDLEATFDLYMHPEDKRMFFSELVKKDLLPFKAIFYLALEKEDFDQAELTRRSWVYYLDKLAGRFFDSSVEKQKVMYQAEKLTSVVGLTDRILVKLRKELIVALEEKRWDDCQKIQNVISARVRELQPEPSTVYERGPAGETVVVVKQPSEQYVKVEYVPRYGAEDVGRAVSLLEGRGGRLTDKQAGTLKMIDILMGR